MSLTVTVTVTVTGRFQGREGLEGLWHLGFRGLKNLKVKPHKQGHLPLRAAAAAAWLAIILIPPNTTKIALQTPRSTNTSVPSHKVYFAKPQKTRQEQANLDRMSANEQT